jgi:ParB family chromosome partitioning protein
LRAAGWTSVEVLSPGERFNTWEHEKTPLSKSGRVYISVSHRGDVEVHEGFLPAKDAKKARAAEIKGAQTEADKQVALAAKPDLSGPMQTYIDLHRHAAVRAKLLDHPAVALRLMVAHAIAGSPLWSVRTDDTRASAAILGSLADSRANAVFRLAVRDTLDLFNRSRDDITVAGDSHNDENTAAVFARLLSLDDAEVLSVLAVVMGETLMSGTSVVEAVGNHLKLDMNTFWTPDNAFFDLLRDRQVVNAVLKDIGGKRTADGNVSEKLKTQKAIIRDFIDGTNNRHKVENWLPKWLAFPVASYTGRPFTTLSRWKSVERLFKGLNLPVAATDPANGDKPETPITPTPAPEIQPIAAE